MLAQTIMKLVADPLALTFSGFGHLFFQPFARLHLVTQRGGTLSDAILQFIEQRAQLLQQPNHDEKKSNRLVAFQNGTNQLE